MPDAAQAVGRLRLNLSRETCASLGFDIIWAFFDRSSDGSLSLVFRALTWPGQARPFLSTLTTTALYRRRLRWF